MKRTADTPDTLYRGLKSEAASDLRSLKGLVLEGVTMVMAPVPEEPKRERVKWIIPSIKSKKPGSLHLGREGVYEYIPFP